MMMMTKKKPKTPQVKRKKTLTNGLVKKIKTTKRKRKKRMWLLKMKKNWLKNTTKSITTMWQKKDNLKLIKKPRKKKNSKRKRLLKSKKRKKLLRGKVKSKLNTKKDRSKRLKWLPKEKQWRM